MTRVLPPQVAALSIAAGVLLAACSSAPTHAGAPSTHSSSSVGSSSTADPGSTAVPPLGTTSSKPRAAGTDACGLVTEQEAGAALGADPGAGQAVASHGASSCMYGTAPSIVTVSVVPTRGKADYDHLRAQATAGQLVDISGVGDAAFGTFRGPAAGIDFYKGDVFVAVVLVTGSAGTPSRGQAITLAKTAASRV